MNKNIAIRNLKDFTDILEKWNCKWFLTHGTCLGAFRDGEIIGHDQDTDIGIMEQTFKFEMLKDLYLAGFEIKFIFGMRFKGFEIAFVRDGVKTDLNFFYEKGDKVYTSFWNNGGRNGFDDKIPYVFEKDLFDYFIEIDLEGYKFKVVWRTLDFIKAIYGEKWDIPTKNWAWDSSAFNIDKSFKL